MIIDYLKQKKDLISVLLLCLSAIFAVSIIFKILSFSTAPAKAENIVITAMEQNTADPNDIKKYFDNYKKLADDLKKKNLFAPPAPKQHPVREVAGIFGDEAIINNRLYKVGDRIGDAKIILIEPTQVTIEWDGKKKTFSPMDAGGASGPGRPSGPRPTARRGGPVPPPGAERPGMVKVMSQTGPPPSLSISGPPPGLDPRNMSEEERAKIGEMLKNIPPDVLKNMSEEERQKLIAEMREKMAGRR